MAVVEVISELVGGGQCNLSPFAARVSLSGLTPTSCERRKILHRQSKSVCNTAPHDSMQVLLHKNLHFPPTGFGVVQ